METALNGVIDTIDNSYKQRMLLEISMEQLGRAKKQVSDSSDEARKILKSQFANMKHDLLLLLDERLARLTGQADHYETEAMVPLIQCEEVIENSIGKSVLLMEEGKALLASVHEDNRLQMADFKAKGDGIGFNDIPEVPRLADVAFISTNLPQSIVDDIAKTLKHYGGVFRRPILKISEIEDRPGGVLVSWTESDEDSDSDAGQYKLQVCSAEVSSPVDSSHDWDVAYQGTNTECLVRGLLPFKPYSFRISCYSNTDKKWSQYSLPQSAMTSLAHYMWGDSNDDYTISDDSKTARKCSEVESVLYSHQPAVNIGHTVTFKVLSAGKKGANTVEEGVGLSLGCDRRDTFAREGAIYVSVSGSIYINGTSMTTKLPHLKEGSKLTFETKPIDKSKVRVTIDLDDRTVTADWRVDPASGQQVSQPSAMSGKEISLLYFGIIFSSANWKITVE